MSVMCPECRRLDDEAHRKIIERERARAEKAEARCVELEAELEKARKVRDIYGESFRAESSMREAANERLRILEERMAEFGLSELLK